MDNDRILLTAREYSATTYYFRFDHFGWAAVTINDGTGELSIQSAWGSFAYRWSPDSKHLGAPSLTAFLADHDRVDYVASKLLSEDNQAHQVVDEDDTLRKFYWRLGELRRSGDLLRVHRDQGSGYDTVETDAEMRAQLGDEARDFVRQVCDERRSFWDVWGEASAELRAVMGHDEPYEILAYRDRRAVEVLRQVILPTLFRHLRGVAPTHGRPWSSPIQMAGWGGFYPIVEAAAKSGAITCDRYSPANYSGPWREWHRGHGCNLDDGRAPRAEVGS
jgi:hypothetical protein